MHNVTDAQHNGLIPQTWAEETRFPEAVGGTHDVIEVSETHLNPSRSHIQTSIYAREIEKKQYQHQTNLVAPPPYSPTKTPSAKFRLSIRSKFLIATCALIIAALIVIPTTVILTKRKQQEQQPQPTPSPTGNIAENSPSGVRAYSKLAVTTMQDNETSFLLYQDISGGLVYTIVNGSDKLKAYDAGAPARNGTPLAIASWVDPGPPGTSRFDSKLLHNYFWIPSDVNTQLWSDKYLHYTVFETSPNSVGSHGALNDTETGVPEDFESHNVAFTAATGTQYDPTVENFTHQDSPVNTFVNGTTFFACGSDGFLHEYHVYGGLDGLNPSASLVYSFPDTVSCSMAAVVRLAPFSYLFVRNGGSPDKLQFWYRNHNLEESEWRAGQSDNWNASVPESNNFCAKDGFVIFQTSDGGLQLSWLLLDMVDGTTTRWGGTRDITTSRLPAGTNLACEFIYEPRIMRVYFQSESGAIQSYQSSGLGFDDWFLKDVPTSPFEGTFLWQ